MGPGAQSTMRAKFKPTQWGHAMCAIHAHSSDAFLLWAIVYWTSLCLWSSLEYCLGQSGVYSVLNIWKCFIRTTNVSAIVCIGHLPCELTSLFLYWYIDREEVRAFQMDTKSTNLAHKGYIEPLSRLFIGVRLLEQAPRSMTISMHCNMGEWCLRLVDAVMCRLALVITRWL